MQRCSPDRQSPNPQGEPSCITCRGSGLRTIARRSRVAVRSGGSPCRPWPQLRHPSRGGYRVRERQHRGHEHDRCAFVRHADGALTPVPGSPFNAGAPDTGTGLASQGSHQVSRRPLGAGRRCRQQPDLGLGSAAKVPLELVPSILSPPGAAGQRAENDGLVYVANAGAAIEHHRLHAERTVVTCGRWRARRCRCPTPRSRETCCSTRQGTNLDRTRVGTSQIDSFRRRLRRPADPPPRDRLAALGAGPFGGEFRPTTPDQLFVSDATTGGQRHRSAFGVPTTARWHRSGPHRSPTSRQHRAGSRSATTGSSCSPSTPDRAASRATRSRTDGEADALGHHAKSASRRGVGAVDARLSTDGRTLYVDESRVDTLGVFAVDGGQLTEQGAAALPAGAAPAGVAVSSRSPAGSGSGAERSDPRTAPTDCRRRP